MPKGEPVRPQRQLIHERIRDVVGRIRTHDGGKEGPGAKRARRERVHGPRGRGVDARSVGQRQVALQAVDGRNGGDLSKKSGWLERAILTWKEREGKGGEGIKGRFGERTAASQYGR